MSAAHPNQVPIASNLNLLHTQLGFDLLVDPDDYLSALLTKDGVYEAPETDFVTRILRAGDTCIDAGCHVGYYSCLFSKLVGIKGRVYAFDASPYACLSTRRNLGLNGFAFANVIHAALADVEGARPFHISASGQSGLSSLGQIPMATDTISVPVVRLDAFLDRENIDTIRLLKLDVEGAEEMVLRGLERRLAAHVIDYILVECFDERLQLLCTSAEKVANVLKSVGYTPWEYGIENPAGWSRATEVCSRGDCNYLFSSPAIAEQVPRISLAAAFGWTRAQRSQLLSERNELQSQQNETQREISALEHRNNELEAQNGELLRQRNEMDHQRNELRSERDELKGQRNELRSQLYGLQRQRDGLRDQHAVLRQKLQDDIDWLLESIRTHEKESVRLAAENAELQNIWGTIQNSASWRILNKWRRVRNRVVPPNSFRAKLYDSVIGPLRRR